jgi:hypothetical protein
MPMKKLCEHKGCENPSTKKERFRVLDENFDMYSFKVSLCDKCYINIYNVKEKMVGDFSVFFNKSIKKKYY